MKKVFLFLTMLLFAFTGTMRAQSAMPNRDMQTLIEEGFESGSMPEGWTKEGNGSWTVGTGDYSSSTGAATGTYNAKCLHSSTGNNTYLITPTMDLSNATSATISCKYVNRSWAGDIDGFGVYYRVDGGAWNELFYTSSAHSTWTATGDIELTDFAANYQIGFRMKDSYGYGVGLDDVVVTADIAAGGGALTTTPDVLDLGNRPNGAWMAPYVFTINGTGTTVNALDFSGNYFTYNAELPATLTAAHPLEVAVTTGTAEEGAVNSTLTVLFSGNRDSQQFAVTANAYNPVAGDVWENAVEVASMQERTDYNTNMPAGIYHNYELPQGSEAADAVYKMTFAKDVLLYAGVEHSADGELALYTEGFEGVGGPSVDNNYVYVGPTVNPGPRALWWYYDYTGTNTWYGTSAGGGFYFGYKISTDLIAANDLAGLTITTVEAAAREAYPYYCYVFEGGATPFDGDLIGMGAIENPEALYFFDINLEVPAYISGNEDIWVIFYSDSPYAAYCGRYPVSTADGKIWTYNPNASSPAWSSNVNYTPIIYARMLELPTGRTATMDLANMEVKKGNGVVSEIAEVEGNVMNVAKANMRNRDMQTLIEEGFEGGSMPTGWTQEGNGTWSVGTGDYSSSTGAATGTYNAKINHGTSGDNTYLITPAMDLSNATSATVSCNYINRSWAGDTDGFGVYYRVNGGAWNELMYTTSAHSTWTASGDITLTGLAANYEIGFKFYDSYGYGVGLDDVVVTADITSGGGGGGGYEPYVPSFTTMIDGMYVPAGTYYLVAASDVDEAVLSFAIADIPAPEPAVIIYPADGETNVEAPYLAEWELGDYTTEMQVLVGTQYPPTTVMIDWTDYLVESAFLMDLEPNQAYFMQVNARNAAGTTESEIVAFTTPIDPVEGFAVENDQLYPGEAAVFTWEANRTLIGYNIYMDGVKLNDTPITENTYSVEGLEYNMPNGNDFTVTAVYGAGESDPSEPITVYMTGTGFISGHVYDAPNGYDPEDPDQTHPVANLPVFIIVSDEYENVQEYEVMTDEDGFYTAEVLAGISIPGISLETAQAYGYAVAVCTQLMVNVAYEANVEGVDIYTHEYYYPLQQITATDETDDVLVEWSWTPAEMIVDFESGDFSQADFTLPATYPWAITTTNPHEGTYCMKSTCEGIASGVSSIEATVEVPYYAKMGFWVRVSSESNYDKFHFYIDGVEQGQALSGQLAYQYKEYTVEAGVHTYKWEYAKDSSVNSNDDCVYVDDITMYMQDVPPQPIPGATVYDFENGMQGWTSLDANNDGYGWVLGSEIGGIYLVSGASLAGTGHGSSNDMVCSGSYSNATGSALTPDNYLIAPTQISAQDGAAIQFYACAQDANYAAEHFGVAVSTTTASAGAFTTIQEWTLTAKSMGTVDMRSDVRGTRAQGAWYQYTVDLSAYAGQDIWVAIRHFNCTDQFILNVDDITLGDGSAKGFDRAGNRSLVSYNLYRRNNIDEASVEDPELIAEGLDSDVMSYVDNDWTTLPYGEWQWGIQATYEGYAPEPERSRETFTYGFEGGLEGWTGIVVNTDGGEWIHSNNNLGGYDYTTLAHTGTGFAMCYSYVDYDGAYDTDAFLVSPQSYSMDASSQINFFADNANDSYPENFSVWVSTAANPTSASDFTQVWSGGAKGTGSNGAVVRKANNNRYENWREHTIDLSAYAGQEVWIAFRDVNYDQYEIWIDDVTITASSAPVPPTPGPTGNGLSEIIWSNVLDKDMISTVTLNVVLNNGQAPVGAEVELTAIDFEEEYIMDETGTVVIELRKGEYIVEVELDGYTPFDGVLEITEDVEEYTFVLDEIIAPVADFYVSPTGWAMWEGATPTPGPTPGEGQWYFYGDETMYTGIGAGAAFYWAVMFPAGSYEGNMVTKVANYGAHDDYYGANGAFSGTVTIYNDGTTSPANAVGTMDITMPDTDELVEFEFAEPVTIDPTKNLWVVFYNATSADYVASACVDAGDPNGRWVSLDGSSWMDLANAGVTGANWMIKVYVAQGAKGEVVSILDPMQQISNPGTLAMAPAANRAPLSYKVFLENEFVGETVYPFFQVPVDGLVEGEEYTVGVAPLYATGMGETMYATFTYAACSNYTGATNYAAAVDGQDVTLTWTLPSGGQPGPGPQPGTGWTEGFENGLPADWTIVDANNDGYTWCLTSNIPTTWTYYASLTLDWYRTGTNAICSGSYINGAGALTPDEYLVMGQQAIANGTTLSFWAAATDASYPADHFGVAVSDNGTDWTMVQEWTLTAKSGAANGGRESRDGEGAKLGTWYQFTADLSAHAGNKYIAIRHFNCNDQYIMCVDDIEFTPAKGERDMWDLVYNFSGTSAGQQAVATDGSFIYTASWQSTPTGGYTFYKYDLNGTFVEGFNITGATGIRDLTFDGDYFYGTSGGTQIFCLDLANKTLVGTINCSGLTSRHISYDPERDGFWSGNWSTLALYSRTGSLIQSGAAPSSAYGSAYYKDADGVEHLYLFCQPNSDCQVYDYNIATNTISSSPVLDFSSTTPGCTGIAGGCFIGNYDNKLCWFGNSQQDPNLIGIYELEGTPGPGPGPQPVPGDVLGVMIWRDGEPLTYAPLNASTFTDEAVEAGEHEYCIRVVYSDYAMACDQCETVTVGDTPACDPVTNLTAELYNYQGNDGALIQFTEPAGATSYKVYVDGELLGSISAQPIFINFEGTPDGNYEIGIVAVYANCESDMATTMFAWDAVAENDVVNAIYPNPTSSDLHINATAMTHVTVYNAMGQMVYDQEVSGDELILNMGQYETGVYMVKVTTETGSSVKRINVVK